MHVGRDADDGSIRQVCSADAMQEVGDKKPTPMKFMTRLVSGPCTNLTTYSQYLGCTEYCVRNIKHVFFTWRAKTDDNHYPLTDCETSRSKPHVHIWVWQLCILAYYAIPPSPSFLHLGDLAQNIAAVRAFCAASAPRADLTMVYDYWVGQRRIHQGELFSRRLPSRATCLSELQAPSPGAVLRQGKGARLLSTLNCTRGGGGGEGDFDEDRAGSAHTRTGLVVHRCDLGPDDISHLATIRLISLLKRRAHTNMWMNG